MVSYIRDKRRLSVYKCGIRPPGFISHEVRKQQYSQYYINGLNMWLTAPKGAIPVN